MNKLHFLMVSAFLLGIYFGYLSFAYPPIDIEAITAYTAKQNSALLEEFFSEKSPPVLVNNGRTVLVTVACDLGAPGILSSLFHAFPKVHFIYDSPIIYTGGVPVEHDWDVTPCFSAEERFGR